MQGSRTPPRHDTSDTRRCSRTPPGEQVKAGVLNHALQDPGLQEVVSRKIS